MSATLSLSSLLKFSRFRFSDKAKNAFLMSNHFSGRTMQRYIFFLTMQRSKEYYFFKNTEKH